MKPLGLRSTHVAAVGVRYNLTILNQYTKGDLLNAKQLRKLITDVLKQMDMYSESALELLMLTAAQESHCGNYIEQLGTGPARGIFQMEPATEKDIWENYLKYKPALAAKVSEFDISPALDDLDLTANLAYQIAIARCHYQRFSERLPSASDLSGLARYWKKYWNTVKGAGTVEEAMSNYNRYALEV